MLTFDFFFCFLANLGTNVSWTVGSFGIIDFLTNVVDVGLGVLTGSDSCVSCSYGEMIAFGIGSGLAIGLDQLDLTCLGLA